VRASGWQRTYLLWTFRNFRGVPHKILNTRQRKWVESLYCVASTPLLRQPHEAVLIGTIEDFSLPSIAPASVSARAGKAVPERESDDTLSRSLSEQLHAIHHRQVFPGLAQTVGAWALVAVMAVLSWQQLRSRPVVSGSNTKPGSHIPGERRQSFEPGADKRSDKRSPSCNSSNSAKPGYATAHLG
jgi:hypothetical protein